MTEWPPSDLAHLHGRLWTVRYRAIVAMLLCAPAIIWAILPLSMVIAPSQHGIRIVLGWAVVIGLFFYLRAIILAAGLLDNAARASVRSWFRVLEVALDRASDTASLVNGTGMYDIVRERTRHRVRSMRVFASALQVLSGFLLLPLFCLALVLALHGAADILAFVMISVLPFVFLYATSAITRAYASVLVHWDRGTEAWDPRPESDGERDARQFAARVSLRAFALSILAGLGAVALFVCVAAVIAAVLGASSIMRYRRGYFISPPIAERMVPVEFTRSLRLSPDSSISAQQAGEAFHNLMYPVGGVGPGMRAPSVRYERFLWPHDVPYSNPRDLWRIVLDNDVDAGLRSPARESFDSLLHRPPHPALTLLTLLAHATDIDVTATRYLTDVDPSIIGNSDGFFVGSDIWLGATIDAALRLRRGDAAGAELRLREMMSAGLLLIDRSPFENDMETGVQLANAGLDGLQVLYERTGRTEAARSLLEVRRAAQRAARGQGSNGTRPQPQEYDLWQIATTGNAYPAVRWGAFQAAVPTTRCRGLRTSMFGLSQADRDRMATAADRMVRIPSDSVLLRAVLGGSRFDPDAVSRRPGIRRLLRIAGLIVGDRQLDSPCLAAFTTRF